DEVLKFANRLFACHWSDSSARIALHTDATSSELLTAVNRFPIRSISFRPQLFFVRSIPNASAKSSDPGRPDNRSITKSRNSCVSLVHQLINSRVAFDNLSSVIRRDAPL